MRCPRVVTSNRRLIQQMFSSARSAHACSRIEMSEPTDFCYVMDENVAQPSALSLTAPYSNTRLGIHHQISSTAGVTSTKTSDWKMEKQRRRRKEATLRERERMHVINAAYGQLQSALPFVPEGLRIPKMTIIVSAIYYIQDLLDMLEEPDARDDRKKYVDVSTTTEEETRYASGSYCQCPCHSRKYIY